jgi:hypothetical protein
LPSAFAGGTLAWSAVFAVLAFFFVDMSCLR